MCLVSWPNLTVLPPSPSPILSILQALAEAKELKGTGTSGGSGTCTGGGMDVGEARARGERVPAALANSSTIWYILTSLHRPGAARDLWHRSPETRNSCIMHFIAPIPRLPLKLLYQIFIIIIDEANGPPLALMMIICKHWHAIVTSIWASLILGTRTPIDTVTRKLIEHEISLSLRILDMILWISLMSIPP